MNIKCADGGGPLAPGEPFTFENHTDEDCSLGDYSAVFTLDTNPVPAKKNGVAGTASATILANIEDDYYEYTASCNKKRENPKIHVDSGKP
jgi:hypothetical protein